MNFPATSSGLLAASATVSANIGRFWGLQVLTDGTNAATVTVYDSENSTISGRVELAKLIVAGADRHAEVIFNVGVVANRGIRVEISGTGANAIVYYSI